MSRGGQTMRRSPGKANKSGLFVEDGVEEEKTKKQCVCMCVWTQSEETSRVQSIPSPLTSHLEAVIERKSAKVRVRQR